MNATSSKRRDGPAGMPKRKLKICHVTSAHRRTSSRIFDKFCVSAAERGHEVVYLVADGQEDETRQDVRIVGSHKPKGRWHRFFVTPWKLLALAKRIDADVYQLHDPELLTIAASLRAKGRVVVFDFHEDLPVQVLQKAYLKFGTSRVLSVLLMSYQLWVARRINGVICATRFISNKFVASGIRSIPVMNFPRLEVFNTSQSWASRANNVVYVGAISPQRGITEVVKALEHTTSDLRLRLAGAFDSEDYHRYLTTLAGWQKVDYLGFLSKEQVVHEISLAKVGMVTLHPLQNYIDAMPIKLFEYMSLGTPVVSSDLPVWREIVEGAECGKVVNPLSPEEIADAIDVIVSDDPAARQMGLNGSQRVRDLYNWKAEEAKVMVFYEELLFDDMGHAPG